MGGFGRRRFLRQGALLAGALAGWSPLVVGADARYQLGLAVIGCGGVGTPYPGLAANERLIALVDVDETALAAAVRRVWEKAPRVKTFTDYRRMFEACHAEIDAVLIATPDHHHAPAALRAMRWGKHVLVQKPLAHNLHEVRRLTELAAARKVVTQMGNQGHVADGCRQLCEMIWAGAIGQVRETHSLLERNYDDARALAGPRPLPAGLHWDEWLGPAPFRPYREGLHPFGWRAWQDFGTGSLGDMGCHVLDGVFWALRAGEAPGYAVECLSQTPGPAGQYPRDNIIRWDLPARAGQAPVRVYSYDCQWPPLVRELEKQCEEKFRGGTVFVGDRGCLFAGPMSDGPRLLPPDRNDLYAKPKATLPRFNKGVVGDFFQACKGREKASNSFAMAGPLTEFVLAGVQASLAGPGRRLEWSAYLAAFTNDPAANASVRRTYRPGWEA
jgi:predicted dehydrogenase